MRIVKEAAERRNEILDVAERLFCTRGYDNTSTNDILAEIGIARGTLYYHFKSKEDILDAVIQRIVTKGMTKASKVAQDEQLSVTEKMTRAVMALNIDSGIGDEVMKQIHKPQNALMHQKLRDSLLFGIIPIITRIVEEGIQQGVFQTDYPREAAEMIMIYSHVAFDDMYEQNEEGMEQRIAGFIYHTERILGTSEGSLKEAIMKIFLKEK